MDDVPASPETDNSPVDAPDLSVDQGEPTSAPPEFFSDKFDPTSLDPSLLPAYKQMQGAFTQKTQEVAAQRKQAQQAIELYESLASEDTQMDALRQLVEHFGYELPEGEYEEGDEPSPEQQMLDEWEQFKQSQAQAAQEAELDRLETHISSEIDRLADEAGVELPGIAKDLVFDRVLALPEGEDGGPQVQQAFQDVVEGLRNEFVNQYRKSKADAPAPPPTGASGSPSVPQDTKGRLAHAAQVAERAYLGS